MARRMSTARSSLGTAEARLAASTNPAEVVRLQAVLGKLEVILAKLQNS